MMFRVGKQPIPSRVGVMVVGLGGNNGSALWALHKLNPSRVLGSLISCADVPTAQKTSVNLCDIMRDSNMLSKLGDVVQISGWDATDTTLQQALRNNGVVPELEISQLLQLYPEEMNQPILKGIVYPSFVGLDLKENSEGSVSKDVDRIIANIDAFATAHSLDFVVVVYSGSTERLAHNPNDDTFRKLIFHPEELESKESKLECKGETKGEEVSPSQVYAIAAALTRTETCFINCAAQNTLVPFIRTLFKTHGKLAIGNDLCTGQTRLKSALLGTFLAHGIPIETIVNFNTLGNNDGLNLTHMETNRSKTQSKCAMVQGAMKSSPTLYKEQKFNMEQLVSISYVRNAGDKKRAMDEYMLSLPFGQHLEMFITSICPDTALAVGVLIDLILITTLMSTIAIISEGDEESPFFWKMLSSEKANALVACLVKDPQTKHARFSLHENRDILTGFLMEACGHVPETFRHHRIFRNQQQKLKRNISPINI